VSESTAPEEQARTPVAELVHPLRPLVGDQAPPRRPEYVSLLPW